MVLQSQVNDHWGASAPRQGHEVITSATSSWQLLGSGASLVTMAVCVIFVSRDTFVCLQNT